MEPIQEETSTTGNPRTLLLEDELNDVWEYPGLVEIFQCEQETGLIPPMRQLEFELDSEVFDGTWKLYLWKDGKPGWNVKLRYFTVSKSFTTSFMVSMTMYQNNESYMLGLKRSGEVKRSRENKVMEFPVELADGSISYQPRMTLVNVYSSELEWEMDAGHLDSVLTKYEDGEPGARDIQFHFEIYGTKLTNLFEEEVM